MGIFAKDAFVANRHGKGGTHSHSIRGWLVRDATKPVPYEVSVCMVPPDESLPCTVLPFDTSWLIEPTTGVHQFGGGSLLADMSVRCKWRVVETPEHYMVEQAGRGR